MTIPYKTSLKYKLCWDFNWKITQRVSHATPAHRYVHIYISLVHFSPHLLKPKHNHHSMSLSLSVLQPQGLFFPSEESITHGRMLGNTAWVEDRGNGNPKPWVPGRSVPVIHSVALCQALSHELVLENKQKISFFFFSGQCNSGGWRNQLTCMRDSCTHKDMLMHLVWHHRDQWWGSFARIPPIPICCKITFFIFNPLQHHITLVSVLLSSPKPTISNCSAHELQLFTTSGRWWQLFLRPVCWGYSTSIPN